MHLEKVLLYTLVCIYEAKGGLEEPKGDPPLYMKKKLQCLKMIFRPFGEKKIKKNWIWKMTLADPPPPGYGIFHKYFFFLNPSLMKIQKIKKDVFQSEYG